MNPVVTAQLSAFSKTNSSLKYSTSEFFEVFAIHSILNGMETESVDPVAVHLKGNEFGIDGIAITIQGQLCENSDDVAGAISVGKNHDIKLSIFQAKTSEQFDYGELSKFFDASFHFFENQFHKPSPQLSDLSAAKDAVYAAALKRNPRLQLYFATTGSGQISGQIDKLINDTKARFEDLNIFGDIQITLLGARALQDGYRSATNSNSKDIEISKPITLPDHPSVQQAFLGFVSAAQLVRLVTHEATDTSTRKINRAVFFDNVRDFNDRSEINKEILADLKKDGQQSFVFKNNGVTVVAKDINRKGDNLSLDDYQIVNGCQTCNILFNAGDAIEDVNVPFRLIVSNDADFVSTIIVGTNRQNEVKDDQFWALKPFMKDLEEYARQQPEDSRLFIERREHQYRDESIERTRIVKPSELVKSIAAMFIFQPHRAARDYRGIRKEYSSQIFQDDHNVIPYHIAAYASYRIDFAIRNRRVVRDWGIYKYYVLSLLGKKATGGRDIFKLKKVDQEKVCNELLMTLANDDALVQEFTRAAEELGRMIQAAGSDTREKIRDYIRSESVADTFHKSLITPKP